MSAGIEDIPSSKNTTTLTSNMNQEDQQKNDKIDKDLMKEISKQPLNAEDHDSHFSPNHQHEKDKVAESLNKWKPQIPGNTDSSDIGGSKEAEVEILSLSVLSPGRPDVVLTIPFANTTSKSTLFTLKEGSKYRTKFHFTVSNNVVNGLTYTYMVWKAGVRVNQSRKLMGTFSPRQEPYTFELEEGTTPTGFFVRGPFLVRSKFVDDDGKCYLDTTYYFDIRKDWGSKEK